MRLDFEIGYDLRGRRHGKSVHRPLRFVEGASVDIPEIDSEEAPVAVVWRVPSGKLWMSSYADAQLPFGGADGCQLTRWFGGRHWLRLVGAHAEVSGVVPTADLDPATAIAALQDGLGFRALGIGSWKPDNVFAKGKRVASDPRGDFDSITSSQRSEAFSAVERLQEDVLVIGGVLHVACAQPGLRLKAGPDGVGVADGSLVVETRGEILDGWEGLAERAIPFSLERWEAITASYPGAAGARSARGPSVLLPESIDPDIEARRKVDMLFRLAVIRYEMTEPMKHYTSAFMNSESLQRHHIVARMIEDGGGEWSMPYLEQNALLDEIGEIEDGMSVDLNPTSASVSPGHRG